MAVAEDYGVWEMSFSGGHSGVKWQLQGQQAPG